MLSARLKVEISRNFFAKINFVFLRDVVNIHAEAIASTSTGSLVDNRPANGGPSLRQCWGRWTQEAEPVVKVMSESESAELSEHFGKLGTGSKVLCQGSPIQEQNRAWKRKTRRKEGGPGKSQEEGTSRPTRASSNIRKRPFGRFLFL